MLVVYFLQHILMVLFLFDSFVFIEHFLIFYYLIPWLAKHISNFYISSLLFKKKFIYAYLEFIFLGVFSRVRIMLTCVWTFLVNSLSGLVFSPEEGSCLLPKRNVFFRIFSFKTMEKVIVNAADIKHVWHYSVYVAWNERISSVTKWDHVEGTDSGLFCNIPTHSLRSE